jgi:hypothetical protein
MQVHIYVGGIGIYTFPPFPAFGENIPKIGCIESIFISKKSLYFLGFNPNYAL